MSRRSRWAGAAVGLVAVGAAIVALVAWPSGTSGGFPTRVAPFTLPGLDGGPPVQYPPQSGPARRPVVLVFFASWCGPCRKELPMVAEVARHEAASDARVTFLGIDGNDTDGGPFARDAGVRFAVANDFDEHVAQSLHMAGLPDTVFVDRSGRIADVVVGTISRSTLAAELVALTS